MLLLWKGGSYKIDLTDAQVAGTIVGVGAGFGILVACTLMPWLYRVVICDDWQLRWWHIPLGPLLLRRGEVPPPPEGVSPVVKNYYEGRLTKEELEARRAAARGDVEASAANGGSDSVEQKLNGASSSNDIAIEPAVPVPQRKSLVGPKPDGKWYESKVLFWYFKWLLLRGVDKDVVNATSTNSALARNLEEVHAYAAHYDNKAEYMYSFLQIMTAATASFTHGANDIANAIGPYATVFQIWNQGLVPASGKSQVPTWILVFGGCCLVLGVWTYGYHIMRNLGNRLTLQSPSRGFSMELGAAITVILATRLSKFLLYSDSKLEQDADYNQNSLFPQLSASQAPPSVSVSAQVPGAPSTGAWLPGFIWAGSSPCL